MYLKTNKVVIRNKNLLILGVLTVLLIIGVSVYLCLFIIDKRSTEDTISQEEVFVETNETNVGTKIEVSVSAVVNSYFNVFEQGLVLSTLNRYCVNESSVAYTEEAYRSKVKYSFDTNDCVSRGIQHFCKFISLESIDSVVLDENVYYVTCKIKSTYIDGLNYWYKTYLQDLTYYVQCNSLSYGSLSKFMVKYMKNYAPPRETNTYIIEVVYTDGAYLIKSDNFVLGLSLDPYIKGLSALIDMIGGTLQ